MQLTLARTQTGIRLGQELGRGGEGAVFAIEGRSDRVAKIYATPPDKLKRQKLLTMAKMANPSILKIAAWPVDLLVDEQGRARGFAMPRVTAGREGHELYSPKSRADAFPEADFRFVVHVAGNIARAFAVVHDHGIVLGDVNHGNLLVGTDGRVMLIDCDSFQVRDGPQSFTCDVGVPLFTAPELQGKPFRGLLRSANHDAFGLAVLVFHLLYMGRHPFAGRYAGPGEMPIEQAIAEYRFAYGPDRSLAGMERPPGTIPLEAMGLAITQLFIKAFGRDGTGIGRPDAKTWVEVLDGLRTSLRLCAQAAWHYYPRQLGSCPWCYLEAQTGARLFGQRIAVASPTGFVDVATLWRAITAVPDPGPDPTLPSNRPWRPPAGADIGNPGLKTMRAGISISLAGAGLAACTAFQGDGTVWTAIVSAVIAYLVWPHVSADKLAEAERAISEARNNWESALARWKQQASRAVFDEHLRSLEKDRIELADIPNERRRRLAKLEAEREMRQRRRYLNRFRINLANIHGIGQSRTAMLASYGIETAADVDQLKIMGIPGFGYALTTDLLSWRRGHEHNFRFNPNEPIDSRDIAAMDSNLDARKQHLLATLRQGPTTLRRINQEIAAARPRLMPTLEEAWAVLRIAELRRKAL